MQELKSFITLDTKQIAGSEGLSHVTNKRISKMESELKAQQEENNKLKSTLAHSVKMVEMQDKMISDLEKQSMDANPALGNSQKVSVK
jgi:septal ring factor EnvC (AmiA/AmiB activator)